MTALEVAQLAGLIGKNVMLASWNVDEEGNIVNQADTYAGRVASVGHALSGPPSNVILRFEDGQQVTLYPRDESSPLTLNIFA